MCIFSTFNEDIQIQIKLLNYEEEKKVLIINICLI